MQLIPIQFDVIYLKDKQSQDKKRNFLTRICRFFQDIKNTKDLFFCRKNFFNRDLSAKEIHHFFVSKQK